MRRSERHHLKANELATAVLGLRDRLSGSTRGLLIGIAIGLGVLVVFGGYSWSAARTVSQAGALLADALVLADAPVVPPPPPPSIEPVVPAADTATADTTDSTETTEPAAPPEPEPAPFVQPPGTYPTVESKMSAALPKLVEAADAYPDTQPGITARYRAAAALAALGRHDEAADQYQQVIARAGTGVYGRMAKLGLADVQMARGAYEEAIALLEQSSGVDAEADLPVDGVLMRLGHAYSLAGRSGEARATFQRVMDDFPASIYFDNALRELESLQAEG